MMTSSRDPIQSVVALKSRLGDALKPVAKLDQKDRHRKATRSLGRKLQREFGRACWYDGKRYSGIDTAHLIAVEMGGTTCEENVALLCRTCHKNYDRGHLSTAGMRTVVRQWRESGGSLDPREPLGKRNEPPSAIVPPPTSVTSVAKTVDRHRSLRELGLATAAVERALERRDLDDDGRAWLLIKRIELWRRRSGADALSNAARLCDAIDPSKLPEAMRPSFFYEAGYLRRLAGAHEEGATLMQRSADAAKSRRDDPGGQEYVAARHEEELCKLAHIAFLTRDDARGFERRFRDLWRSTDQSRWGKQRAMNCMTDVLHVRLRANDPDGSWEALKKLRETYDAADISSGWTSGRRQQISQLEGLVRVLFPKDPADVVEGIRFLARAFMTRIGDNKLRFEGIRDTGIGLATGLRKLGKDVELADKLEGVMYQTVDGTSVLWPWRAVSHVP
jgi:hypothetical protein